MKLYAESSAILSWLLGEPDGRKVQSVLAGAESVLTSELTMVECDRVLIRAHTLKEISEGDAADRRAIFQRAAARWHILRIAGEIVGRARHPFPREPVRTLDAIHLASALVARSAVPGLALLSLDDRIRSVGHVLGMEIAP